MDQAITATISRYSPIMALLALLAATAPSVHARTSTERPVGIVDQPCPPAAANVEPKATDPWLDRLLDPDEGREIETPDTSTSNTARAADDERLHYDWAQLCRYRAENAALRRATGPRVVFMGDSITEFWKPAHPEFFTD